MKCFILKILPLVDDLISYMAVGARSVEDQQHRFVAEVEQISRLGLKIQPLEISMLCLMGFMLLKTTKFPFPRKRSGNNWEPAFARYSSWSNQ